MNLETLIASAREDNPEWSGARTEHAIMGARTRLRRAMIIRRAFVVAGAATAIFLFVLRGASAPPQAVTADASSGDAGYARD